jgi:2-dehydro-3-deoxyphosphooctonate aldolase (KDO 8-P synthase)
MAVVVDIGVQPTRSVRFGAANPLGIIAGPCVIETEDHVFFLARALKERIGAFVFKASFDKANRSSIQSYRGPGLKEGLRILRALRAEGFPTLTDIHEPSQAGAAAGSVDVLQIPAFLCRQTDLLVEAGRTGLVVNIKKGQFVSPKDILNAADKVASTGNTKILLTERGSSFGYNNLVVDMRGLQMMRESGYPVIFDATHSVQLPGAGGDRSAGQPQYIETLARAAVATGIEGIFLEVHEAPERALSDGANSVPLANVESLASRLRAIDHLVKGPDFAAAPTNP